MPLKIYDVFKYDLQNLMMACLYEGSNKSCLFDFKFQPESQAPCYAANLDVSGYGIFQYLETFLYLDPNMTIGKHTPKLGSYVTFSHVENFVSPINGFFLAPNDAAVVSATGVYTHQRESFPKAKCTFAMDLKSTILRVNLFMRFTAPNLSWTSAMRSTRQKFATARLSLAGI